MIGSFLYLFAAWIVGAVVRFLIDWIVAQEFDFKKRTVQLVLVGVLGAIAAFFGNKMNLAGVLTLAVYVVAGFLSIWIINKLVKATANGK